MLNKRGLRQSPCKTPRSTVNERGAEPISYNRCFKVSIKALD